MWGVVSSLTESLVQGQNKAVSSSEMLIDFSFLLAFFVLLSHSEAPTP